jgi:hypothetical protein
MHVLKGASLKHTGLFIFIHSLGRKREVKRLDDALVDKVEMKNWLRYHTLRISLVRSLSG